MARSAQRRSVQFDPARRKLFRLMRHVDTFMAHSRGHQNLAIMSQTNQGDTGKLDHDLRRHLQTGQRVEVTYDKTRNVISDADQSRREEINGA